MQVRHDDGVAIHIGPKPPNSCDADDAGDLSSK